MCVLRYFAKQYKLFLYIFLIFRNEPNENYGRARSWTTTAAKKKCRLKWKLKWIIMDGCDRIFLVIHFHTNFCCILLSYLFPTCICVLDWMEECAHFTLCCITITRPESMWHENFDVNVLEVAMSTWTQVSLPKLLPFKLIKCIISGHFTHIQLLRQTQSGGINKMNIPAWHEREI